MVGRDEVGGDAGSFLVLHCDQQVCIVPARVAVTHTSTCMQKRTVHHP